MTATKDGKKVVAVTDAGGVYIFPDLEDGVWNIKVEMLAFTPATKDIGVVSGAPGAEWELKMMTMDEIKPSVQAQAPPSTPPLPRLLPRPARLPLPPTRSRGRRRRSLPQHRRRTRRARKALRPPRRSKAFSAPT